MTQLSENFSELCLYQRYTLIFCYDTNRIKLKMASRTIAGVYCGAEKRSQCIHRLGGHGRHPLREPEQTNTTNYWLAPGKVMLGLAGPAFLALLKGDGRKLWDSVLTSLDIVLWEPLRVVKQESGNEIYVLSAIFKFPGYSYKIFLRNSKFNLGEWKAALAHVYTHTCAWIQSSLVLLKAVGKIAFDVWCRRLIKSLSSVS